jgi:hypothetical protein
MASGPRRPIRTFARAASLRREQALQPEARVLEGSDHDRPGAEAELGMLDRAVVTHVDDAPVEPERLLQPVERAAAPSRYCRKGKMLGVLT